MLVAYSMACPWHNTTRGILHHHLRSARSRALLVGQKRFGLFEPGNTLVESGQANADIGQQFETATKRFWLPAGGADLYPFPDILQERHLGGAMIHLGSLGPTPPPLQDAAQRRQRIEIVRR